MATYEYEARARDGKKMTGEMEAANVDAVAEQLKSIGVFPLRIAPKSESKMNSIANMDIKFGKQAKLTTQDLVFFSRQMYTLTRASVPIMQALDGLISSSTNPALNKVIADLRKSLDEGLDLTGALRRQRAAFPEIFINLVQVGEMTGQLAEVFDELSNYLQKEQETRDRVKSALRYPMMVMAAISIGLVIINVFVLPNFSQMYSSFGAELPLPTRILIGFSNFMINYWYICLAIPVIVAAIFIKLINTSKGRMTWHRQQLGFPLFGDLLKKAAITRFARSLAITSKSGVPMEQALRVIAPTVGNQFIEEKINAMRAGVERGESITANIKRAALFPGIVVQMISVGEESGSLDAMVDEIAIYYERELDYTLKALTGAIEPIMVVIIAVLVLVLALGIFLPMISIMGAIGG